MEMIVIVIVSLVLGVLPLLIVGFFQMFVLPRKLQAVQDDVKRVAPKHPLPAEAGNMPAISEIAPHVQELGDRYFRKATLFLPALLLTFFYLAGFALCDSYIADHFKVSLGHW